MITHYGLQIESPFDLNQSATVAISIKKGETKTIDRGEVSGLLAIVVEDGATLDYKETISTPGLYHTYVYLQGKESSVNMSSRIIVEEDVADISHQVIHEKNNTVSNITARGVAGKTATVIYTSKISVNPSIENVEGRQDAQFMILDQGAKVKTIPGLSVYSDEVSCSHKVSVTPIEPKILEFLAMRGYTEQEARKVIIEAFLN